MQLTKLSALCYRWRHSGWRCLVDGNLRPYLRNDTVVRTTPFCSSLGLRSAAQPIVRIVAARWHYLAPRLLRLRNFCLSTYLYAYGARPTEQAYRQEIGGRGPGSDWAAARRLAGPDEGSVGAAQKKEMTAGRQLGLCLSGCAASALTKAAIRQGLIVRCTYPLLTALAASLDFWPLRSSHGERP
jgi:hypothetical protein